MTKGFTLEKIAAFCGGKVAGDPGVVVCGIAPFETAGPADITFAGSPKFLKRMETCKALAVIVPDGFAAEGRNLIHAPIPYHAFALAMQLFYPDAPPVMEIHPTACIGQDAELKGRLATGPHSVIGDRVILGDGCRFGANVVIGDDVVMGENVRIHPNVTIYPGTRIGSRVIIHSGSVIGSDGFGFAPNGQSWAKIPHTGFVEIGDDVELGAGNTIDRGTFGRTWIQDGVKTDNQVHIAHNVTIGAHTLLVGQVGVAGSATIGHHTIIAGKSGVSGHLTVGNHVTVGPMSGITQNVPDGKTVTGTPEMPHRMWLKVQRLLPRLPEMRKRLAELERKLDGILEGGDGEKGSDK